MSVHAPTEALGLGVIEETFATLEAAEALLSTWRPDTELSRLNAAAGSGPMPISPELSAFLASALAVARQTDGAFDPTVGAFVDAWDLRGDGRLPSARELRRARRQTGYQQLTLDKPAGTARLATAGCWIDSGGSGKGWALDRAGESLRRSAASAALIDLGGQLLAVGAPPGADAWRVALADPRDRSRPVLEVALVDASLATSAQSERALAVGGRTIGHVLDPRTGQPVDTSDSVSVLAASATEADALSTALLVMGQRPAARWLAAHPDVAAARLTPCGDEHPPALAATPSFRARLLTEPPRDVTTTPPTAPVRGALR